MVAATDTSSASREQMVSFNDKYQIVLSSCRLLTEAQSALDRSIKDFVAVAETINPNLNVGYTSPVSSPSSGALSAAKDVHESSSVQNGQDSVAATTGGDVPNKKEKKTRDPDMPKRPASAFFLFQNAIRNSVKAAMPDESKGVDIQKAVSDKWKDLDEAGRKPYNDQHERETQEYEARITAYNREKGIAVKPKTAARNVSSKSAEKPTGNDQQGSDDDAAAASLVQDPATNTSAAATPKSSKKRRKSGTENIKKDKTPKKVDKVPEEKKKKRKKTDTNAN